MTTEIARRNGFPLSGILIALMVWFGGMAAAAVLFDPMAVIVFAPHGGAVTAIASSDGALLTSGLGFAIGTSEHAGFVRRL